jgi:hypothetical protein
MEIGWRRGGRFAHAATCAAMRWNTRPRLGPCIAGIGELHRSGIFVLRLAFRQFRATPSVQ